MKQKALACEWFVFWLRFGLGSNENRESLRHFCGSNLAGVRDAELLAGIIDLRFPGWTGHLLERNKVGIGQAADVLLNANVDPVAANDGDGLKDV
jgi:hypothetical protein